PARGRGADGGVDPAGSSDRKVAQGRGLVEFGWVPWWLSPMAAVWLTTGVVTMAQVAPIPVHGALVVAGCGLLALGHGLVHRRWLVAGPVAVLSAVLLFAASTGLLPDGFQLGPYVGPAQ